MGTGQIARASVDHRWYGGKGPPLQIPRTDEDKEIAPRHRTCSVLVWPGVEPGVGGRGPLRRRAAFPAVPGRRSFPGRGNSIFHQEHAGTGNDQTGRGNSEA